MDLRHLGEFDRVYTYARVSSVEQADKRGSIETQRSRLMAVRPSPDKHFEDVQSGDEATRPDYIALVDQAKSDALKGLRVLIVITEQSRLSREGSDRVTELIEMFDALNICLYALDGGKRTAKEPHEWLMMSQEALFNQYFLRQHRRNLRNSKAQKRKEGKPINPSPPFGYKWTKNKYEPNDKEWKTARLLVEAYLPQPEGQGVSLRKVTDIAREHGCKFSASGIRQWLKNPVLQGHLYYTVDGHTREEQKRGVRPGSKPRELRYNTHQPLISEHEAKLIEGRLQENKQYARCGTNAPRMPLSGLVKCANCDRLMSYHTTHDQRYKRKYPNYVCRNREGCDQRPSMVVRKIEDAVYEAIAQRAKEFSELTVQSKNQEVVSPEEQELQRHINDLRILYERSPVSGIRAAIEELEDKLERLRQKAPEQTDQEQVEICIKVFSDRQFFSQLSEFQKRRFYHLAVREIHVGKGGKVQVTLAF